MLEALGEFADAVLEIAHNAMSSPWIYVVILVFATIDSVLPLVPAETLVITAGVFAASGVPSLPLVILFASTGAYIGDHLAYGIGHVAGGRIYHRSRPGSKRRAAFGWAQQQLQERGGLILVVCRQIPGGRTAVTLTAGTVRYPLRKFSFFEIFAALSWGLYAGLIGYFGGLTFGEEPLKGLALGFSIAIAITVIVEASRFWINRRRRRALETAAAAPISETASFTEDPPAQELNDDARSGAHTNTEPDDTTDGDASRNGNTELSGPDAARQQVQANSPLVEVPAPESANEEERT